MRLSLINLVSTSRSVRGRTTTARNASRAHADSRRMRVSSLLRKAIQSPGRRSFACGGGDPVGGRCTQQRRRCHGCTFRQAPQRVPPTERRLPIRGRRARRRTCRSQSVSVGAEVMGGGACDRGRRGPHHRLARYGRQVRRCLLGLLTSEQGGLFDERAEVRRFLAG